MKHKITLANGTRIPALGQGTWHIGDNEKTRTHEIESIQAGIASGMTLIDTAEMYGNGRAEQLVGEAINAINRKDLYIVSKVLPQNAGGQKLERSLDGSLNRLKTDYLDLYLYHWRGSYPLQETVDRMEEMVQKGKIRAWGVSNFDIDDMEELLSCRNGNHCMVNQVLYHLGSRGIEFSLLPWMIKHQVALMAYCPLAQGGDLRKGLFTNPVIVKLAQKYKADVSQILLAWSIRNGKTVAIPKSARKERTLLNAAADSIHLTDEDLQLIDSEYPAPTKKMHLNVQ
ncbi:aldo/keto reductase [Treponema phagedenis]|uniref:aldo/keto reductase n=1 Tax=Treponema phagedenis TaxID=162 RepID=UPI00197EED28|nr:aldo/keto reductase [Treponema phagedenis]QSH95589.1 hypothetical protein C5O78_11310 [Treponema phagedenis]